MAAKKGSPKKAPAKKSGKKALSKSPAKKKTPAGKPASTGAEASGVKAAAAPPHRPAAANWFEIPAADFDRAKKFYGELLAQTLPVREWRGVKMAFLDGYPGGAVVAGENYIPTRSGALVYLNAGEDLSILLPRIEPNGGRLELPKTMISPELGYYAIFIDTEGNRVALHSMK